MSVKVFRSYQTVRFRHCDLARIVFYPRYFEMVNSCVELWFEQALDHSFATLHECLHLGIPTVDIKTQFHLPSRLEDQLALVLKVLNIGRASMKLEVNIYAAQELRVSNQVSLVLVGSEPMKPVAWASQPALLKALQEYI